MLEALDMKNSDRKRIKVLYVINGMGTGGAERSLAELIEPMSDQGVDYTIACLYERRQGVADQVETDVRIVGDQKLSAIRRIRRLIHEIEPDLIHTTVFESDILGRLASIGTGVPVVTSLVNTSYSLGEIEHPDISRTKLEIARIIDSLTARYRNAGFHSLTHASKAANARALRLNPDSIVVIPRGRQQARVGRNDAERRADARSGLGLAPDEAVLLSVGRREHQKGQIHAIEAMPHIHQTHPGAILLVAGRDGSASSRLERRVQDLGLRDSVHFLGHREDVPDLMVASDVLVFPSLYEGLGGTLIEAMALGLPIVASDISVLREVADGVAFFARGQDSEDLARAIRDALSGGRDVTRRIVAGQRRFVRRYVIESVAQQMDTWYREVASRNKRS